MIIDTLSIIGRNVLWQSALLTSIVFCILYALPRGHISARYRVALSGLFGAGLLLALPFLPSWHFDVNLAPEILRSTNAQSTITTPFAVIPTTLSISEMAPPEMAPTAITLSVADISETRLTFPFGLALTFMWLIGSCVALSRLGFAVWQGQMLSRRFMPVIFNGATLSRSVTIVRSKGVSAPFVFGFLKPVIVVPGDFSLDLANLETRVILEHEIAHIVRGDLWVNLAQRLILALLWWCIPLYWINRQIGAERENLCDARATAQTKQNLPNADNTARMLAGALLRFAEQKSHVDTPALAIGIHANLRPEAKLLARRIQLLCDNNPVPQLPKKLLLSTTLAVPMTLLMLSIVTPRASAENPQALQTEGIVSLQKTTGHREEARIKKTTKPAPHANIVTGRMTSKYGVLRKHLNNKFHNGIDIANKTGTPIYAPADALVIEATDTYKNTTKWGKVVVIETRRTNGINGNVQTVFAHLDGYSVDPGQTIKAGDIIGQVGNTGKSTGSHVHIATLIDGQYVDPMTVWPDLNSFKK